MNRMKSLTQKTGVFRWSMALVIIAAAPFVWANQEPEVIHLSQDEFVQKIEQPNVVIIDIRTPREYAAGHIEGAINHDHQDLLRDSSILDQYGENDLVFYCHTGVRVKRVTERLKKANRLRQFYHLKGDMRAWRARGLPLVKIDSSGL